MTHQLPVARDYVKLKAPKWFEDNESWLNGVKSKIGDDFLVLMEYITKFDAENPPIEVPTLESEFDTSDFVDYMVDNSLLKKIGSRA